MSNAFIQPGAKIGVMAPSSIVDKADIETSAALMERKGYSVFVHPQTYAQDNQSAGTTTEKLEALHSLYADDSIDCIWAAGGGNRSLYMLEGLNYGLIKDNPKPLIGFSDVTALLNGIHTHTGQAGFHAQVFKNLHKFDGLDHTLDVLTGQTPNLDLSKADIVSPGSAEGPIIGGNLSLFHCLPGTPDCPPLQNAILMLEDCSDELSRFDRMLIHLRRAGVFDQISALVLGEFTDLKDSARPFGFSLKDCVLDAARGYDLPIIMNAPFGHEKHCAPFPVGGSARLSTDEYIIAF